MSDQDKSHKQRDKRSYKFWQLIILLTITVGFTILNNLASSMMGYVMPGFPSWLLYATTAMYIIVFMLISFAIGERPFSRKSLTKTHFKHYCILGVATILNGITFQFSAPWIDGDLSQILTNLGVPIVAMISVWWLKHHYSIREWIGITIVCLGVMLGFVDPIRKMITGGIHSQAEKSDLPWGMLCFAISAIIQNIEQILQERAFDDNCRPATTLFWYNLISWPAYLMVIPFESVKYLNGKTHWVDFGDSFTNQWHAFRCTYGFPYHEDTVGKTPSCQAYAWLWPNLFVIGYSGMFFFNAIIIRDMDALYAVVISAMVPPMVGFIFTQSVIVGPTHTTKLTWFIGVSFFLIFIGILAKGVSKTVSKQTEIVRDSDESYEENDANDYMIINQVNNYGSLQISDDLEESV